MKQLLLKFWPLIFIFCLWFIFTSPYFLNGKAPYASSYQNSFFAPWSHYQKFWGPVKNNAMPDIHTQIYPWKKFTIDTYKNGQIPIWNPYSFAGNPHLANFQSAVLSPLNLLFFIFSFIDAWSLLVLLQPILAGLFMYLFARSLKISNSGSLISAVSFMFCGFMVVWMAYATLVYAILYLPLALWAVEEFFQKKQIKHLLVLIITLPLSFFSGHFQISLYFLLTIFLYILFKGIISKRFKDLIYLLLSCLLGFIFSLPQILSSIQFYLSSVRSQLYLLSEAIPLPYLITILSPDFFGNPVTRNDWFGHYAEWAGFIGIWPFVLAIFGVLTQMKKSLFFFLLGIISLIMTINSPLSNIFVSLKIPVLSNSALSRIIVLFSFSFAVLSGIGFDELQFSLNNKKNRRKILICLFSILIFMITAWFILFFVKTIPDQWLTVAKRNFLLPTVLFAGGMILISVSLKFKKVILLTTCYLLLATSYDSFRFAQKWMPFDNKNLVYPSVPIIEAIQKNIGEGRIFGNLGADVLTYYKIKGIEGYDPLYIGRYGEFLKGIEGLGKINPARSVVNLPRRGEMVDRVLDLLGVSLIFQPTADTNQGWAYPVWENANRYKLIYKDDKFELFKNQNNLPRVWLYFDYQVIKNDNEILKTFYNKNFDIRQTVILEQDPNIKFSLEKTGQADIILYTPNEIMINVLTKSPAILFLSDNDYPIWKAEVNGKQTEIMRADYTFRSVAVPAGSSKVRFILRWF